MNVLHRLPPRLKTKETTGPIGRRGKAHYIIAYDKHGDLYCYEEHSRDYTIRSINIMESDADGLPNRNYLENSQIVFLAVLSGDARIISSIKCWSLYKVNPTLVYDFRRQCYLQTYPHMKKQEAKPVPKWRTIGLAWDDILNARQMFNRLYLQDFEDFKKDVLGTYTFNYFSEPRIYPLPFKSLFEKLQLQWYWTEEIQQEEHRKQEERSRKAQAEYIATVGTRTFNDRFKFYQQNLVIPRNLI